MTLEEIAELKTSQEIKEYVDKRIHQLEAETKHEDKIGFEHLTPHKGFIDKNTIITNVDSYCCISSNRYAYIFTYLLIKNKINNLDNAIPGIFYFLDNYFGQEGDDEKRLQIFEANQSNGIPDIALLERKNCAVCAERAALAQNLFSLLGIESFYVTGRVSDENELVPHAFNVINYKGKYFLFDASMVQPIYEEGRLKGYKFYTAELTEEQLDILFNAGRIQTAGNRTYESYGTYKRETTNKNTM